MSLRFASRSCGGRLLFWRLAGGPSDAIVGEMVWAGLVYSRDQVYRVRVASCNDELPAPEILAGQLEKRREVEAAKVAAVGGKQCKLIGHVHIEGSFSSCL